MKVFNYIRVSTKEQNEGRQIEAMKEWNEANNVDRPIQLIDKCSGTNKDRPKLQMLLEWIDKDDVVVIKSIDRLSRNYKECREIWQEITGRGADIVVIDMPILDTRTNKDLLGNLITDLFLTILGYVAQQETDFRKQRQAEGIALAKQQGKHLGRPRVKYPENWHEVYIQWRRNEITATDAMKDLGLKRNTFYKLVKEYEEV